MTDFAAILGGARTTDPMSADINLSPGSDRLQKVIPDAPNRSVFMPTTRAGGTVLVDIGTRWLIQAEGADGVKVVDRDGDPLSPALTVDPGFCAEVWCTDNSTQKGAWEYLIMSATSGSGIAPPLGYILGPEDTPNEDTCWEFNPLNTDPWTEQPNKTPVDFDPTGLGPCPVPDGNGAFLYVHNSPPASAEDFFKFDPGTPWDTTLDLAGRVGDPFFAGGSPASDPDTLFFVGSQGPPGVNTDKYQIYNAGLDQWGLAATLTGADPNGLSGITGGFYGVHSTDVLVAFEAQLQSGDNRTTQIGITGPTQGEATEQDDRPNSAKHRIGGFYLPGNNTFVDLMGQITFATNENSVEVWEFTLTANPGAQWVQQDNIAPDMDPRYHFYAWASESTGYVAGGTYFVSGSTTDEKDDTWQVTNFVWSLANNGTFPPGKTAGRAPMGNAIFA